MKIKPYLFILLFLLFKYTPAPCQVMDSLFDSTAITITKPSQAKENVVFSDDKLKYDHKIKDTKGFFDELLEWLSEKLFGKKDYNTVSSVREIIIWTIIIVSVIIIIWLLSRSELAGLIKPKAKATAFNFTDITDDLTQINFDNKINEALKTNDLRLAIRWNYLKVLFVLDKNGIIVFAPYKTNIDYSNDLLTKSTREGEKKLHSGFMRLSRIYEYVWYGQFSINENDYQNYAAEFEEYQKQLNV